jgi:hypothetical protein
VGLSVVTVIGPTCPRCGWIHAAVTVVGSRFRPGGITGYRSALGGPVRATRDEAARDWCDTKRQQRNERPTPRPQAAEPPHLFDLPRIVGQSEPKPPPEFPTALMETAARAKAWRDFLAQARMSLLIWQIDTDLHDEIEHVLTWLRRCSAELADLTTPRAGAA